MRSAFSFFFFFLFFSLSLSLSLSVCLSVSLLVNVDAIRARNLDCRNRNRNYLDGTGMENNFGGNLSFIDRRIFFFYSQKRENVEIRDGIIDGCA